jgi:hypothetical protein
MKKTFGFVLKFDSSKVISDALYDASTALLGTELNENFRIIISTLTTIDVELENQPL